MYDLATALITYIVKGRRDAYKEYEDFMELMRQAIL